MSQERQKAGLTEIKKARGIDSKTQLLLLAKSAGRCEICNSLVTHDERTQENVFWGEKAHIYAFNPEGPRAKMKKLYNNDLNNLLLACPNCHTKIDKGQLEKYYTVSYLKDLKTDHENRIKRITGIAPHRITKVLKVIANINNQVVKLDDVDMIESLMNEKLIPHDGNQTEIDFTNASGLNDKAYWKTKSAEIDENIKNFYQEFRKDKINHISIFAIGPIPLLMHLGSRLDSTIKTKFFQRHKDGDHWKWRKGKAESKYGLKRLQEGKDKEKVALLLSLSGHVEIKKVPKKIDENYYIYELFVDPEPNYNFLRTEKDIFEFAKAYTTSISKIKNVHKEIQIIDLFPAIPAPIAVMCGRSLNKNADPKVKIYNLVGKQPFKYSLTINQ